MLEKATGSSLASLAAVALCFHAVGGCQVSTLPDKPPPGQRGEIRRQERGAVHYAHANDAPEISRDVGEAGGVVVLWPRIAPRSDDPATTALAEAVQSRMAQLAGGVSEKVNKRPAPERVCPKEAGCRGASLGAVLAVKDGGCAVVGVVSRPGVGPATLVPWVGTVQLKATESPFREPPESLVTVSEFVPCDKLRADLASNAPPGDESALRSALSAAAGK